VRIKPYSLCRYEHEEYERQCLNSRASCVPHIHAVYGEHEISVEVETGTIYGQFPPRALKLVLEWMSLHTAELLENWQLAKQGQPLKRIAPLE
jgi:hypothetical protein